LARSRSHELLSKSVSAMLSAIEAYNKPDHKYREETFSILALNAWELLLKSKLLYEKGNKLSNLYIYESKKLRDGSQSHRKYIKRNRSGNPLVIGIKKAINVWLEDLNIHENREGRYKIIVKDLLKEDSEIKKVVSESLASYKPIREKEIQKKSSRSKQEISLELPQNVLEYSAEYELVEKNVSKNTMEKFYQRKEYLGKKNETDFIKYIDKKKSVKWWHKNGDEGSEHFAIVYYDKEKHRERLFYPDWIILLENGIKIITDSKAGETASSLETKEKAEALQKWIKDQKDPTIIGGISVKFSEGWKINRKETYNYDNAGKDFEYFDTIVDEMKL